MGTSCGKHFPKPTSVNPCDNFELTQSNSNTKEIDNFCTLDGPAGRNHRDDMCDALSSTKEWEYKSDGSFCQYDDCNETVSVDVGCCKGCCGIDGHGVVCVRKAYNASPISCCLANYNSEGTGCHTNNGNSTCPPNARSNTGTGIIKDASAFPANNGKTCRDLLLDYCTGGEVDAKKLDDWKDTWKPGGLCNNVINWNLYGQSTPLDAVNDEEGFQWTQKLIDRALKNYLAEGNEIGIGVGMPGYNSFQDVLYNMCNSTPGLCDLTLSGICRNQTTGVLLSNPGLIPWCGCYLSNEEYSVYADEFQVPKECTPICARQGNIKPGLPNHSAFEVCTDNICLLNDVAIQIANAEIGDIDFSQICGGCGIDSRTTAVETAKTSSTNSSGGNTINSVTTMANRSESSSCVCIIENNTVDVMNARLGGINLKQHCGGDSTCYATGKNGVKSVVDCSTGKPITGNKKIVKAEVSDIEKEEIKHRNMKMIIFSVVAVVILIFLLFVFRPGTSIVSEEIIYKTLPANAFINGTLRGNHNSSGTPKISGPSTPKVTPKVSGPSTPKVQDKLSYTPSQTNFARPSSSKSVPPVASKSSFKSAVSTKNNGFSF
jgi:hypothetical protein